VSTGLAAIATYDGVRADDLARRLRVRHVASFDAVGSTMDVAHDLAEREAGAGTLVLADTQLAGRGRGGKQWTSDAGRGIWFTLLERNLDSNALDVLALRLGLAAARALDEFAAAPVQVKWPNDLYVSGSKLAGILVEARWRDGAPEWVAIGVGVNVVPPRAAPNATGLRAGTARLDVLDRLVPALRDTLSRRGPLDSEECRSLAERDLGVGRAIVQPGRGTVEGIAASGELIVRNPAGLLERYRSGSLVFQEDA
jgi:BirA family biotin operon repressor/biotin-[acetyl-CoA-carboxylase] ligase